MDHVAVVDHERLFTRRKRDDRAIMAGRIKGGSITLKLEDEVMNEVNQNE